MEIFDKRGSLEFPIDVEKILSRHFTGAGEREGRTGEEEFR